MMINGKIESRFIDYLASETWFSMKNTIVLLFMLFTFCSGAQVYERHYKVHSEGEDIGSVIARKRVEGDVTHYEVNSKVSTNLVHDIDLVIRIQAGYEGGVLRHSSSTTYLNGDILSSTFVQKKSENYDVTKDGHRTKIYLPEIKMSSAKLYFQEPEKESSSLSEMEGIMKSLENVGDKKYELKIKGDKRYSGVYTFSSDQGLYQIQVNGKQIPEMKITGIRHTDQLEE